MEKQDLVCFFNQRHQQGHNTVRLYRKAEAAMFSNQHLMPFAEAVIFTGPNSQKQRNAHTKADLHQIFRYLLSFKKQFYIRLLTF